MTRLVVVAASVAVLVGAGASGAFAGEVKGPPNQLNNTNETGALDHANSACAASGLNDFDLSDPDGQVVSQVQTAADSGSSTGFRRVPQASSDSARAELGRGKTRAGPGRTPGPSCSYTRARSTIGSRNSRATRPGDFRVRLLAAAARTDARAPLLVPHCDS